LIIAATNQVFGEEFWPEETRHVREIWASALDGTGSFRLSGIEAGALLVIPRRYTFQGRYQIVAGHIGLITDVTESYLNLLHARARTGTVEETVFRRSAPYLGAVTLMD
jgi:hypothetical protein